MKIVLAALTVAVVFTSVDPASGRVASAKPGAQVAAEPTFEVASIRMNRSVEGRTLMNASGDRYTVTNAPVRFLILNAYGLQEAQLVGGPGWVTSARFDIIASRGGAPTDQVPAMMRALLAERFKLKAHYETRDMPMFALVIDRNDGRPGKQLVPASCDNRPLIPQPDQKLPCNTRLVGPGRIRASGLSMRELSALLTMLVGRIVIDKSGVSGIFDFELTWAPEQRPVDTSRDDVLPPADRDGPSLFTALREQLGLRLDGERGPVDVLVIDSIEQPSEN